MADLETPETTPPPVAATPPPAATPEPPAPPPEPEEPDAVEVQGGKYVPLAALMEERKQGKALKEKAQQFDQVAQYVATVKPYIDFLQQNPDFMQRAQQPAHTSPQPEPVDEAAEQLAKTLDLYTPDGKPDVRRAQSIRQMVRTEAEAQADARVRPLAESTTRERATHMYQRALATKAQDGRTPQKEVLDAIWARTDPRILATEEGATAAVMLALGMGSFTGQPIPTQAPQTPPVVTERPGSRQPNAPSITALDEKIAGMRGRSTGDWSKLTQNYNPGRTNVLED